MHLILVALLSSLSPSPSLATPDGTAEVVPFEITLERSERGWRATCARGCFWEEVSVTCARECPVLVDVAGISTQLQAPERPEGFAFLVERTPNGWRAYSRQGTAWTTVLWECGTGACPGRIDETGVGRR